MNRAVLLLIGLGALDLVSCKECDSTGCRNGALLNFSPTLTAPGNYAITGMLDARAFSCQVTLDGARSSTCDTPEVRVVFEGTNPGWLSGLAIDSNPTRVTFEIQLAGAPLATGEASPSYQVSQPNGASCEPTCRFSEATVSLM